MCVLMNVDIRPIIIISDEELFRIQELAYNLKVASLYCGGPDEETMKQTIKEQEEMLAGQEVELIREGAREGYWERQVNEKAPPRKKKGNKLLNYLKSLESGNGSI